MRTSSWMLRAAVGTALGLACAGSASATPVTIDWMNMTSVPMNGNVPNNSNFFVAGVGLVNVTYSFPATPVFTHVRAQNPDLVAGSVTFGSNTYSWTNHEHFATIATDDPFGPVNWSITFTFPSTIPAGQLYVGVAGLGQTTSFGGGASTATVNQNGTFLGDWSGSGGPWGPTQFTGGVGTFSMQNSQNGPGGQDPWWNTPLGIVRIDDAVSSLTINMGQLRGDGVGVNIGFSVPGPGAAAVAGLAGLMAARRRR